VEAGIRGQAAQHLSPHTGTIEVSPVAPIALEQGDWQGHHADSGVVYAAGRYSAKWREIDGRG
jgi:hypothetical protein